MPDKNYNADETCCSSLDRRSTIKFLALGSASVLAGVGFTGAAQAQCPQIACVQEGWRWCSKCQGMFYGLATPAQGGLGVCPAGGTHTLVGSAFYYERVGAAVASVQQGGWSWCAKCMGFFYSAGTTMGACPAGARHINAGSAAYAAVLGNNGPGQQGGWRWCNKCMGMFYSLGGTQGVCPAGGAHNGSGSAQYASLT